MSNRSVVGVNLCVVFCCLAVGLAVLIVQPTSRRTSPWPLLLTFLLLAGICMPWWVYETRLFNQVTQEFKLDSAKVEALAKEAKNTTKEETAFFTRAIVFQVGLGDMVGGQFRVNRPHYWTYTYFGFETWPGKLGLLAVVAILVLLLAPIPLPSTVVPWIVGGFGGLVFSWLALWVILCPKVSLHPLLSTGLSLLVLLPLIAAGALGFWGCWHGWRGTSPPAIV
jgi:hypothetical protein